MAKRVEIGIEVDSGDAVREYKKLSNTVKTQNKQIKNSADKLEAQAVKRAKEADRRTDRAIKLKKNEAREEERKTDRIKRAINEEKRELDRVEKAKERTIQNASRSQQREIKKITNAKKNAARQAKTVAQKQQRAVQKAERKKQQAIKETLRKQKEAISKTKILFLALSGLVTGVFVKSLIDAQRNLDKINNALKIGTGSAEAAAVEFSFLERESERLGLPIESTALSYAKFTAAAKNSNLTTKEQREVFLGVSEASAALGLSADESSGAMNALQQMMSKGCFGIDTSIRMFDKSIRLVQNIIVGDQLMGDDGTERTVLKLARNIEQMYLIEIEGKENFRCNEKHILSLKNESGEVLNITVIDFINGDYKGFFCYDNQGNLFEFKIIKDVIDYYYGFEITGNRLFCLGSGIVVHNTVQAEELRGQLGERIPGAFSLAAKAMGLTEKALGKQLELGNVLAEDLLPKLAAEMRKTFGKTASRGPETLNGRINLLNNAFLKLKKGFLEAGGLKFLTTGFNLATKAVKALNVEIDKLDKKGREEGTFQATSKDDLERAVDLQKRLLAIRAIVSKQPPSKLVFDPTTRRTKRTGSSVDTEQRKEELRIVKELTQFLGTKASLENSAIQKRLALQDESIEKIKKESDEIDKKKNKQKEVAKQLADQLKKQKEIAKELKTLEITFKLDDLTDQLFSAQEKIDTFRELSQRALEFGTEEQEIKILQNIKSLNDQIISEEEEKNNKILEKQKELEAKKQQIREMSLTAASQITGSFAELAQIGITNQIKSIELADKQASRDKQLSQAKTKAEKKELADQFAKEDKINGLRKQAFETQKKFALAQAGINTASGVVNALTIQPPHLIPFAIALALATGAAQAAVISQQKFARGGMVDGPRSGDKVPILANGGERVLTARQNQAFESMANGGSQVSFGDLVINVNGNGDPTAIAKAVVQTRQEQVRMFSETSRRTNSLQVRTV